MQIHAHIKINPGGFSEPNVVEVGAVESTTELTNFKAGETLSKGDVEMLRDRGTRMLRALGDRFDAELDVLMNVAEAHAERPTSTRPIS